MGSPETARDSWCEFEPRFHWRLLEKRFVAVPPTLHFPDAADCAKHGDDSNAKSNPPQLLSRWGIAKPAMGGWLARWAGAGGWWSWLFREPALFGAQFFIGRSHYRNFLLRRGALIRSSRAGGVRANCRFWERRASRRTGFMAAWLRFRGRRQEQ